MAQLSDKAPDVLPRSELNPLTNPALERNLSRWAEVYFGTPPAKREQAISKLLQEIRRETLGTLKAESARSEGLAQSAELQEVACPSCRQKNPLGHKFCRECGAALYPGEADAASDANLAEARAAAEASAPKSQSDVQWLRDRALGSLSAYENSGPPRMDVCRRRLRDRPGWFCLFAMGSVATDRCVSQYGRLAGERSTGHGSAGECFLHSGTESTRYYLSAQPTSPKLSRVKSSQVW